MATLMYSDATLIVNSVDLSNHVRSLNITYEAEMLDDTVMGTSGTRSNFPGLKNWTMEANFLQDFDAGSIDATLFPLVGATPFPIEAKPTSAAVSATNPKYSGNAVLETYPPITGEVGTLAMVTANFRSGGGSPLARTIIP
jgi:hypothetical protein